MSGIITGPYFVKYFKDPTAGELGIMVSVLEIGAFFTSIAAGRVGDMIGRRGTLFIGAIIFTIGGAVQTFTVGFWTMVVGRIISGCGVGLLSCGALRPLAIISYLLAGQLSPFTRAKFLLRIM